MEGMIPTDADWRPSASIENLIQRAQLLKQLRHCLDDMGLVEVETPLFAKYGVTQPHTPNLPCQHLGQPCYLQTSPEYFMKRLLCAGMGDCYQIARACRDEPAGRFHQPEFAMLEWYRRDITYLTLAAEVVTLIQRLSDDAITVNYRNYQQVFADALGWRPEQASVADMAGYAAESGQPCPQTTLTKDEWCDWYLGVLIEPWLAQQPGLQVIHDFPGTQASLAKLNADGTAKRFEIYMNGLELANGFEELADASEQQARFLKDNIERQRLQLPVMATDPLFIAALAQGKLGLCSGVALGVDRLMMCLLKADRIGDVVSFAHT